MVFAFLGGFDLKLGALEEGLVALQVGPVRVAPDHTAVVVDIARRADRQHEGRCLHVVELFDVSREDVH